MDDTTPSAPHDPADASHKDAFAAACRAVIEGDVVVVDVSERAAVLNAIDRLAESYPGDASQLQAELVVRVVAASQFLRRFLIRHPGALQALTELPPARDVESWRAALGAATEHVSDEAELVAALRIARQKAMLGMTARELVTGDPLSTGADLAAFASAALDLAIAHWVTWFRPRYGLPRLEDGSLCQPIVIGMGKLGGGELNFSSDIDVIFAYSADGGQTDGAGGLGRSIDVHTYFSRLFAKVGKTLSQTTEEGFVFRVDLDLRPEGGTGPICNSVAGLERYYESFGHSWERLAWIKARPVAGDLAQGAALIARLAPFVYRKSLDFAFADEVAAMKGRIDARGARLGRRDGFNVKLGRGGIREVEFAVQTLQLMWGGKLPELRAVDTRTAIARLVLAGLLETGEADGLLGAYRFLRRIEHALQLRDDRQTHTLPGEPVVRRRIAALLGFGAGDAGLSKFEQALGEQRRTVRAAFEEIVAGVERPTEDLQWEQAFLVALDADASDDERGVALKELGFEVPATALLTMRALVRRPDSPFHPRAMARGGELARKILAAVVATADPDAAFGHTERMLRTLRHRKSALDQLDADPRRLRTLLGLFGTSHLLSRLLVRSPGLLDRLVFDGSAPAVRTVEELEGQLASEPGSDGDWEAVLGAVRRFHQAEVLRIGFFDLAGLLDTAAVGRQLSDVADVIVRWLVAAALPEHSQGASPLGVIGLGKLAGRALGYGSDLDIIFVHDGTQPTQQMTRVARRVITGLSCATPEGTLYAIDTRLRPSGNQGPLCVTRKRLLNYHRKEAQTWEKQAVLRTRAVNGELQPLVETLRSEALGVMADDVLAAATEVDAMLTRLRETRGREDLKLGQGGLVDVEFLVQFLQLTLQNAASLGLDHPAAAPGTRTALAGLAEVGAISVEQARACDAAYGFLRLLENRLFLVQDSAMGALTLLATEGPLGPKAKASLRRLALRMGYGEGVAEHAASALQADYIRHRETIATTYKETFGAHLAPTR